jgi:RHS repeat-associated protein
MSGLYYYGARYYDPWLGRFITADGSDAVSMFDPQTLNRYSYALNNPTTFTDPDGNLPIIAPLLLAAKVLSGWAAGAAIGGAIGGATGAVIGGVAAVAVTTLSRVGVLPGEVAFGVSIAGGFALGYSLPGNELFEWPMRVIAGAAVAGAAAGSSFLPTKLQLAGLWASAIPEPRLIFNEGPIMRTIKSIIGEPNEGDKLFARYLLAGLYGWLTTMNNIEDAFSPKVEVINTNSFGIGTVEFIDPRLIRWTQDEASPTFQRPVAGTRTITELEEALKSGRVKPYNVTPIHVVEVDGVLYTLDNRRLAAFRAAGAEAIPVVRLDIKDSLVKAAFKSKFDTKRQGLAIFIRVIKRLIK